MSPPLLLASSQGISFLSLAPGQTGPNTSARDHAIHTRTILVPVSQDEQSAAQLLPTTVSPFRTVAQRPDLLSAVVSRMVGSDRSTLEVETSHEGTRMKLVGATGKTDSLDMDARDILGFLASFFSCAPRGICETGLEHPARVLLSLTPAGARHEYRARLMGVMGTAPQHLPDTGMSPRLHEAVLDALARGPGLLLVSGTARSGRSTTLEAIGSCLAKRGMIGSRIGSVAENEDSHTWLADSIEGWPFLDDPMAGWTDFVIMDPSDGVLDLALTAQLASSGRLVLASAPASDPARLARKTLQDLESSAAPATRVMVLGQQLVRTVCKECSTWETIPAVKTRRFGFDPSDVEHFEKRGGLTVPRGRGCGTCTGTGAGGMVGVFDFVDPQDSTAELPSMREDACIKVLQGLVILEDVASLPGAFPGMRPLQGTLGLAATPTENQAAMSMQSQATVASHLDHESPPVLSRAANCQSTPDPAPSSTRQSVSKSDLNGPRPSIEGTNTHSLVDADAFAECLLDARSGQANIAALDKIIASVKERALIGAPLESVLAPSQGFHLGRHSVNTALIAIRIGDCLDDSMDPALLSRLGILHDVGLVQAGVNPAAELPATVSKESLDHSGSRMKPGPILRAFGLEPEPLEDLIQRIQKIHGSAAESAVAESQTERYAQVVALASLIEMHSRASSREHTIDVHDATTIVMQRYQARFDPVLFGALLRAVPIFPIGCLVELSSGDLAKVVSLNEANHYRPRVEIRIVGGGKGLPERRVVDLARAPFLHIRRRVVGSNPEVMRGN